MVAWAVNEVPSMLCMHILVNNVVLFVILWTLYDELIVIDLFHLMPTYLSVPYSEQFPHPSVPKYTSYQTCPRAAPQRSIHANHVRTYMHNTVR